MQLLNTLYRTKKIKLLLLVVLVLALAGCENQRYGAQLMRSQPRFDPLEENTFFEDHRASRPLIEDTVAQGYLRLDEQLYTGKVDGAFADTFPMPITAEVLERGQSEFNVFCSPCHGHLGNGEGMVVQRGFPNPPTFHSDRLRNAPPGYFFNVITNGFGKMYKYDARIIPEDRWAIVAYIEALQLSQNADISLVPSEDLQKIGE